MASVAASGMHKVFVGGESVDMTTEGLAVFMGALLDREGASAAVADLAELRRELADLKVEVKALHEKVAFLEGEDAAPPVRSCGARGCYECDPHPLMDEASSLRDSGARTLMSPDAKALLMPFRRRSCGDCE